MSFPNDVSKFRPGFFSRAAFACFVVAFVASLLPGLLPAQTSDQGSVSRTLTPEVDSVPVSEATGITYVIPVKGMIEKGLLTYVVRKGLAEAVRKEAAAVIFEMDTPGGLVESAEDIVRLLIDLPPTIRTYTLVDKDALSAGAFIAMATDEIYMTPGSRIGASAIVLPWGDIPEGDQKEKAISATLALVVRAAEAKGYDVELVEAMMRKETEYRIGDEVICPAGELLTLTDVTAMRMVGEGDDARPLLARGVVKNLDELLERTGRAKTDILVLEITWSEKLARWIAALRILFLAGGLLGLYIEIKTPGFGVPGILGILLLIVFFWGHLVAGLAGMEEVLLFTVGAVLLAVEIFVIPGFGFVGIAGILCMIGALILAMVQHNPGAPLYPLPPIDLQRSLVSMGAAMVVTGGLILALARFLPKSSIFQRIVLAGARAPADPAQTGDSAIRVGIIGTALTPLHPSGAGDFNGTRLPVVARGEFIDEGTPIVVAETHGNRIVVDRTNNT